MSHVLLAVGCNDYEHANPLHGAENDAETIFALLTNPRFGDCDPNKSILVKSPSYAGLRSAIILATQHIESDDVLTFFFAGHGIVKAGTFYMCLSDTMLDQIAATAFPLNNLLSAIQDASPRHANVLIDACNSGGVAGDFRRALSQEGIGDTGTTEISLLAACARNQLAYEEAGRGVFTRNVLECVEGTIYVQDTTELLDLADVAGVISHAVAASGEQQPVFWGFNLTGRPNFCRNPHSSDDSPLRKVLAEAGSLKLPPKVRREIYDIHLRLEDSWNPQRLQQALADFFESSEVTADARLGFCNQLLQSLRIKGRSSGDDFREVEVSLACLAPLLNLCPHHAQVEAFVLRECEAIAESIVEKIAKVTDDITNNRYGLLGELGLGELYFLPIRIFKLLGWMGWATIVQRTLSEPPSTDVLEKLLSQITSLYAGSVRAISEVQAPYLLACCAAARETSAQAKAEELVGYLFVDMCDSGAMVADEKIRDEQIIEHLIARSTGATERQNLANPSVLAFTLLYVAYIFELDEAFDIGFQELDHLNVNAFVPETYVSYCKQHISDGCNITVRIGHDAWCLDDIRRIARENVDWPEPENPGVSVLSGACSLLFPDRVAWHLVNQF